jgi:hypothetical protein
MGSEHWLRGHIHPEGSRTTAATAGSTAAAEEPKVTGEEAEAEEEAEEEAEADEDEAEGEEGSTAAAGTPSSLLCSAPSMCTLSPTVTLDPLTQTCETAAETTAIAEVADACIGSPLAFSILPGLFCW